MKEAVLGGRVGTISVILDGMELVQKDLRDLAEGEVSLHTQSRAQAGSVLTEQHRPTDTG